MKIEMTNLNHELEEVSNKTHIIRETAGCPIFGKRHSETL